MTVVELDFILPILRVEWSDPIFFLIQLCAISSKIHTNRKLLSKRTYI